MVDMIKGPMLSLKNSIESPPPYRDEYIWELAGTLAPLSQKHFF